MIPRARQSDLLVEEVGEELVVYDRRRERAHCLNRAAALVWRNCDGRRGIEDLNSLLDQELGTAVDENFVWLALDRLERAHLLDGELARRPSVPDAARRELLKRSAVAMLIPAVTSISAPTPAQAVTEPVGGIPEL